MTRPTSVYRPRSNDAFPDARFNPEDVHVEWEEVEIEGPDIENRHTLQQLAMMSGNAYALPGRKNWYDLDGAWNESFPFGWEDTADGFRGHIFASSDNSTIILSIKGTTIQGPTSKKDKFNDNLLFSCCCARVDISWIFSTVCDCFSKHWRCDNTCLSEALMKDSLFYSVGVNLYRNLTSLYPSANIWLTGHSLGGALAALLGTTFGVPSVAFESPGELLAAQRLHLSLPPQTPVTHVYHNADPIPQGACTGIGSVCAQSGYALETTCHLGKKIVYDTMGAYGWRASDVTKHTIREIVTVVLADEREWEPGRHVPLAVDEDPDCLDSECYKWEFGDFKHKDISS
ncbi:alpha/beta-hydrolase [Fomitiporia mediterranea MF3/22]|uniref:alpha/beta-hydrolase n=1 Tax=Fomitiporia mediterranea (strain MF3/22) TaxID=694068 RepID=UPI000440981B|nr:alpha/beta-hydrolase [Fomitiporia mediterranea MF3/22]EJD05870.1 alpha/beta-hydrolase [Fomitiporia mediterranea MF3/22]